MNLVVFCGENPNIMLVNASETTTAAASYWTAPTRPTGRSRFINLSGCEQCGSARSPVIAIYADNASLARYLTDTFNQHFEDWQQLGFSEAAVQQARFSKASDSRQFYRITCSSDQNQIDLLWSEFRDASFRTFPDLNGGGFGVAGDEHYHVANAIFLCGQGSITINQRPAAGAVQTRTSPEGRFLSSVFVALAETWIKADEVTGNPKG